MMMTYDCDDDNDNNVGGRDYDEDNDHNDDE